MNRGKKIYRQWKRIYKQLVRRWKATTPKLFKVIRNISATIALTSGTAAVTYAAFDADLKAVIPLALLKIIGISGLIASILSQLTKEKDNGKVDINN